MPCANAIFRVSSLVLFSVGSVFGGEGVRLEIDKDASRIAARADATGHRFDAVVTDYDLDLRWDPERGEITSARLVFDFADVVTGRDRRDREMREWLDYGTFPEAEFLLDGFETEDGRRLARGVLSLHGAERAIAFPVSVEEEGDEVNLRAETTLDYRKWDLDKIRALLFLTVDPVLEIEIDLKAALPETGRETD